MATENMLFNEDTKFIREDFNKRLIRLDDALRAITPESATILPDDQLVILLTARKNSNQSLSWMQWKWCMGSGIQTITVGIDVRFVTFGLRFVLLTTTAPIAVQTCEKGKTMTDKEKLTELLLPMVESELAGDCSSLVRGWADHLLANGVIFAPAIPGPSDADPNIMELCFHNGERHMKEKILKLLSGYSRASGRTFGPVYEHIISEVEKL